jgi:carotenoid isomerooxygenase
VDTKQKDKKIWCEKGVYPSEPIFVPDPNGKVINFHINGHE